MPEPRKEPQPKTGLAGTDDGTLDPREEPLRERKSAVAARGRAIRSGGRAGRATTIVQREAAVAAREEAVLSREDAARLREEAFRAQEEAAQARADRERLLGEIREVNEQLVVATLQAERMSEEAQKANHLKDGFLAVVSHELRTPLNAILGWARLLNGRQVNEDRVAGAISTIERNASALAHIIDDLLDVSRSMAGTLSVAREPVDLVAATRAVVDTVTPIAAADGIDVRFSHDLPCELVSGDAHRLQQVVSNLLSNAIKFTPRGGTVDVSIRCTDYTVELAVADTGQGISPDALPHVFERFWQADATPTRQHQGLGLGLAIVRELVELHDGTIGVDSPGLGQGATFTVRLPRLTALIATARPVATEHTALPLPRLDGVHVLLVEDHADSRELVATALAQAGANVTTAGSVKEALQALDEGNRPHALVSDIGLPDEDGCALIERVREREARGGFLPAVALSGYTSAEDRARILAAGYHVHVSKPVELAELAAAIAALTRATRAASPSEG